MNAFLTPSYATERNRRYPVVDALHGYSICAARWSQEIHAPLTIEDAFAQGAKEMIVVLPDSKTVHNESMYSSSATIGDFERFIAHDIVSYIDAHSRTIAKRTNRGLVGHSVGRYGASRIGMKHHFRTGRQGRLWQLAQKTFIHDVPIRFVPAEEPFW